MTNHRKMTRSPLRCLIFLRRCIIFSIWRVFSSQRQVFRLNFGNTRITNQFAPEMQY
ncbi:unnamed protein product [Gongylonema pulchrum]|uniref:Uncharacterized protein n=1 Tax=Gongylonema pulchrum TaxID=637853 RepID=A0A183D4N2_9BILA|nr:unnamed protein product [Gongylonema pulchrum]